MKIAWLSFVLFFNLATPALAATTAQEYITDFTVFLSNIILPFLFGIAFLVFLINITRYFIIGGASETERAKAKSTALYGIAAFVFLFSLWSITTLLIQGFSLTEREAICPDYITDFGGSSDCTLATPGSISGGAFPPSIPSPGSGGRGGGGNNNSGGAAPGGSGSGSGGGAGNITFAGLAELVFGTGKDNLSISTMPTDSASISQNIIALDPQLSCQDGVNALALSSRTETAQAVYAFYKNNGNWQWQNITSASNLNTATINRVRVDALLENPAVTALHVLHTHPDQRPDNLGLVMSGHGPSASDLVLMCNINSPDITFGVIDEGNSVWIYKTTAGTCPYSLTDTTDLAIIETYLALSELEATTRFAELQKYISSNLTNQTYDAHFTSFLTPQLNTLTSAQIRLLSLPLQNSASSTVTHYDNTAMFCATL